MANHKSAEKRHRQSLKRRQRNRVAKGAVRTAVKKARAAIEAKDETAAALVREAEKTIAKAAAKGIFHRRNASRQVSRLASKLSPQA
jgi:small subunit ribosomal protein S20